MYGRNDQCMDRWMQACIDGWMDTSMQAQIFITEQRFWFKTNVSEAFDVTIAKIVVSASLNK